MPFQVAIIGGGLCGLSLAIALRKRSIDYKIYEARSSFTELGAGINIGPNTLQAFRLIDPSLGEALQTIWCRNPPGKEDIWMQVRLGAPSEQYEDAHLVTDLLAPPTGNVTVQRNALLQILAERAGYHHAVFDKKLAEYSHAQDGVVLKFTDGSEERASAVVSCDGIHSAVRRAMLRADDLAAQPKYAGAGAYRGLIATEHLALVIGEDMARTSQLFLGPNAYIIMYPVDHGQKVNVGFWPWRREPWENEDDWVLPSQREAMETTFSTWGDTIHMIMDLMGDPPFFATHYHAIQPPSHHDNRVCLIGDAAHAMVPHQGQGAAQAMEDAYVMAEALSLVDRDYPSQDQIAAAFEGYESVRTPRSQRVLETSQEAMSFWTDLYEAPINDERLQQFVEAARRRFAWIWQDDIAAQARRAVTAMKKTLER